MRRMLPTTPAGQPTIGAHPDLAPHSAPTRRAPPTWFIILVFCVFAGLIAETFVTASTSPVDILQRPLIVPFNMVLYGAFDLLAREIMVRRRSGLASALLLGAAYGFINEGVVAGTWYVIHPQGYLLIGGVDWAWALALTIFHTFISVFVPIAFIELLFPSIRGQSLLRRRGIVSCMALLLGCVVVAVVILAPQPLRIFFYRMIVLAVAIAFSFVAWRLPARRSSVSSPPFAPSPTLSALAVAAAAPAPRSQAASTRPLPGLWRLRIAGFLAMFGFFFLTNFVPTVVGALLLPPSSGLLIAQGVYVVVFLAFYALVVWRGWTWSQRVGWSPRENLALLIGGVTFTTLLLNVTEAPMGEVFSTVPFYALLVALTFRWRRRAQTAPTPATQ